MNITVAGILDVIVEARIELGFGIIVQSGPLFDKRGSVMRSVVPNASQGSRVVGTFTAGRADGVGRCIESLGKSASSAEIRRWLDSKVFGVGIKIHVVFARFLSGKESGIGAGIKIRIARRAAVPGVFCVPKGYFKFVILRNGHATFNMLRVAGSIALITIIKFAGQTRGSIRGYAAE